jgi:hypothetical protein
VNLAVLAAALAGVAGTVEAWGRGLGPGPALASGGTTTLAFLLPTTAVAIWHRRDPIATVRDGTRTIGWVAAALALVVLRDAMLARFSDRVLSALLWTALAWSAFALAGPVADAAARRLPAARLGTGGRASWAAASGLLAYGVWALAASPAGLRL